MTFIADTMRTLLTKNLLESNNWQRSNFISVPGYGEYVDYGFDYDDKFHFIISFGNNNSGRVASLHIDNQNFETIASAEIDTIEQFNLMMKIIECDYGLN